MELNWPRPIYHDPQSEPRFNSVNLSAARNLLESAGLSQNDVWHFDLDEKKVNFRAIRYPFYPGITSVEARWPMSFDEGTAVGAWLLHDADFCKVPDDKDRIGAVYFLDGSAKPILELNAKLPLQINDRNAAADYLKFFCSHVWDKQGGFFICENYDDLPLIGRPDDSVAKNLGDMIGPIQDVPLEESEKLHPVWGFRANIVYGKSVFEARFKVLQTGVVEMLGDELIERDLPLAPASRVKGFRQILAQ